MNENETAQFVKEIQRWIGQMDFTLPEGTTIVVYSGDANGGDYAWEVAREISTIAGDKAVYIRDTPPEELLNDPRLEYTLKKILGNNGYEMVVMSYRNM